MIGAGKPDSRACPVVLDPTVAASFVGLIGDALGADAVQRGRSPFAERLGEEVAGEALALHDDGTDPGGLASSPFDGEGVPAPSHGADRGRCACAPSCTTPTPRAAAGAASTANAGRSGYRVPALGLGLQPDRRAGRRSLRGAAGRGRRGRLRHRRRRSALRGQPGLRASSPSAPRGGRSAAASWPSRCASSRSPATWSRCCGACAPPAQTPRWVPFGGSVSTPPLLIGEMAIGGA